VGLKHRHEARSVHHRCGCWLRFPQYSPNDIARANTPGDGVPAGVLARVQ